MSWNYRLVSRVGDMSTERFYSIHECYYEDGVESYISFDPIGIEWCDDVEEIKSMLEKMKEALDKPVLKYEDF